MKILKVALLVLLACTILGIVFWETLTATYIYLYTNHIFSDRPGIHATPTSYILEPDTALTNTEQLTLKNLEIQLPFLNGVLRDGEDYKSVSNETKHIIIIDDIELRDAFLASNPHTSVENESTCDFLSESIGGHLCQTNYSFFKGLLNIDKTDISLFSTTPQKLSYSILLMLKASLIISATLYEFETDSIKGFIFYTNELSTVIFFDDEDKQFLLNLKGFSKEEQDFILSNITSN